MVILTEFLITVFILADILAEQFPHLRIKTMGSWLGSTKKMPIDVLISTVGVAGTGITLTAARFIMLLEPQSCPVAELQVLARIWRIGQPFRTFAKTLLDQSTCLTKTAKDNAAFNQLVQEVFDDVSSDT
ncbi:hypothetical protein P152DRAFT_481779 [Eremomyces bilateralis CBS 781.70]|uniref:Helicase C-terminal domain-containing protein n=1 Tax=Eremomyces bilateralis CBS 781.70 TaxID=1392243 RepID=A0A6G1G4H3_9PEZI|nr:uncharacterized protein P152DRAFT_481779 [Eremomyces bilateralis CBS 781.70]KAF1812892.1 hypothetical protein P152DRAFT_481779 [Eremomyces bilateralis CBS 781.70]